VCVQGPGHVVPQDIDLAVVGHQLTNVSMDVFNEPLPGSFVISASGAIRVMPVHQRIIEAHSKSFGACSIYVFLDEIPSRTLFGRAVTGGFGVEKAKAFVMFGGHHDVLLPGYPGELCPFSGGIWLWLELPG